MKIYKNYFYKEHEVPSDLRRFFAGLWEFSIRNDMLDKKWSFNSFHLPNLSITSINNKISIHLNGSCSHKSNPSSYGGTMVNVFELKPYLLKPVFGVTAEAILNRSVSLHELTSSKVKESSLIPWLKYSFEEKYLRIGNLLNKLAIHQEDDIISRAVDDFIESKGILKTRNYIEALPISERQFQRRFKKETGLSPLNFLKKIKLSYLSQDLIKNDFKDNSIVFDYGYFDQPHYIRDFKDFHGCSPLNYRDRFKIVKFDLP